MEILHMGNSGCSFQEQEGRLRDCTAIFAGRTGGKVIAATDAGNLVEVPRKTNHILHAVLSFMTFFFWVPMWLLVWAYNVHNPTKYLIQVTGQGQVFAERVK